MFVYDTPIERFDTFLYLGTVVKCNHTFQTTIKNNVEKAKKSLQKLAVYSGKIQLEVETQLHVFDALIKPILFHGCEVWDMKMSNKLIFLSKFFEK